MDATITKMGWTICMTSFPKWPPAKSANFIFSLISASKTHRDMILVSIPMFLMARNPLVPLLKLYDCWLTQKFKMAAIDPVKIIFPSHFQFQDKMLHRCIYHGIKCL